MTTGYIFTAVIEHKEVLATVIDITDTEKSIHHEQRSWLCYGGNTLFAVTEDMYSEDVMDDNGFVCDTNVMVTKRVDKPIAFGVTIPHLDRILNEAAKAKEDYIYNMVCYGFTEEEAIEAFNETAISNGEETIR